MHDDTDDIMEALVDLDDIIPIPNPHKLRLKSPDNPFKINTGNTVESKKHERVAEEAEKSLSKRMTECITKLEKINKDIESAYSRISMEEANIAENHRKASGLKKELETILEEAKSSNDPTVAVILSLLK